MINEEYYQNEAEKGNSDKSTDALAYQKLFNALKHDGETSLSPDFADRVVSMVQQRQSSRVLRVEVVLGVAGGLFSFIVLGIAIVLTGFKIEFGVLESLDSFKGLLVFGIIFAILLSWLEKFFLRKKAAG